MVTELTWTQFGSIVGTICGVIFGLILLIIGLIKKNIKFGIIGFVLSLIVGPVLSLIGVLPIFATFLWLILRKPKTDGAPVEVAADSKPSGD